MKHKSKSGFFYTYGAILQRGAAVLISLTLLIVSTLAWFTQASKIHTTGMQLSAADIATLRVTARSGLSEPLALTVDMVNTVADADRLLALSVDSDTVELSPGVSGSFTAYITTNGANNVNVLPQICAGGVTTVRNNTGVVTSITDNPAVAYRAETSVDEQNKALNYLQGHIMMFREKTNDIYSDWISPYEENPITVTDGVETAYTVYWVWIDSYSKLCTPDMLIAEDDLARIRDSYFVGNSETEFNQTAETYLFDKRDNADVTKTMLSHYYDFGDENIGVTVNHIYFRLEFSI